MTDTSNNVISLEAAKKKLALVKWAEANDDLIVLPLSKVKEILSSLPSRDEMIVAVANMVAFSAVMQEKGPDYIDGKSEADVVVEAVIATDIVFTMADKLGKAIPSMIAEYFWKMKSFEINVEKVKTPVA